MSTLKQFFTDNPTAAIAFSGGVDSSYLLYAAKEYGANVQAYYVKSEFQPTFEFEDARRIVGQLGVPLHIISLNVLSDEDVAQNPSNRCYYCKKRIFSAIISAALNDGYRLILDGTNASDDISDRPGFKALQELSVRSPLRECGLTKDEIRKLSKQAGLFTWNKPAYACLATRIPVGERITADKLIATEEAEKYLFSLGFENFRVRSHDGHARIQVIESQIPLILEHRKKICENLKKYYSTVSLDLEVRK